MRHVVALGLIVLTVATLAGFAAASDSAAVEPVAESRGDIVVHGHWEIEVLNPDGSLVTRREFDNALTADGQELLARILARARAVGAWSIQLSGAPSPCLPADVVGCTIFMTKFTAVKNSHLTVTNEPLKLSGFIDVAEAGSVNTVRTLLGDCLPSVMPVNCGSAFPNSIHVFSLATITNIPVAKAQRVAVTVTFSFSSAP